MPVSNPPAGQVVEPASVGSGITGLLSSPDLSVGPGVRGWLESGGIDPRAVSVLGGALGRFSVGVGGVDVVDSPAGAQVLDIVSVDGEPVGPQNFAARELVGWLAGLQPGVRPDEIGSPWSIHSPGFFSDGSSTASIRLVFDLPSSGTTPPTGTPIDAADMNPSPPPPSPSLETTEVSPAAQGAYEAAQKELGVPYLWGGESPQAGFDCSGLMQWAYHQAGISIPRTAAEQATAGTPVSRSQLHEGDLVFFRISGGEIDHVGMYVGHDEFIEAPRTGEVIQKASLNDPYWAEHFAAARRIVALTTSQPAPAVPASPDPAAGSSGPAVVPGDIPGPTTDIPGSVPGLAGTAEPPEAPAPPGTPEPPATPGPPGTGTISFRAVPAATTAASSNTVQFLPVAQPAAVTPTAPEVPNDPTPQPVEPVVPAAEPVVPAAQPVEPAAQPVAPAAQPVEPAAQPVVPAAQPVEPAAQPVEPAAQPVVPAAQPVEPAAQPVAPAAQPGGQVPAGVAPDQLVNQVQASIDTVPPGTTVSVSSHLLTDGQAEFAAKLAQLTGLSPRVIASWELAEESGQYAQGREAQHDFNWLNIAWYDSGRGGLSYNAAFGNPATAAEQTAKFLKGTWGGASDSIRAILSTASGTPAQQIAAIANSDWASTHYDGGANLRATFGELSDMKVEVNSAAPSGENAVQSVSAGAEASVAAASGTGAQQGDVTFGDLQTVGAQHNWTDQQLQDWWQVIKIESGGQLDAQNPSSSAYGIAQFISGASEYAKYGGNSTSVTGQLTAMANYIAQRYGSPSAALAHEHSAGWY